MAKVLLFVDGSVSPADLSTAANRLLPKAAEMCVLRLVPQLPSAWIAWPAFPDAGADLAQASRYVSEVRKELGTQGWHVTSDTWFSVLSAAEMDQEICRLAETRRPDLLWLALEPELVVGRVVRKMPIPVLITKPSAEKTGRSGRVVSIKESLSPSFVSPAFRLIPALFRGRRVAGAVP